LIKNIVIVIQTLLILAGVYWLVAYKHVVEQTHLLSGLGHMANETRFITRVERKISDNQCSAAQDILTQTAAMNVEDMKELVEQLDIEVPSQLITARGYAEILHDVGIHEVSDWIELRAAREDEAAVGGT
jgi:hypothetical protein